MFVVKMVLRILKPVTDLFSETFSGWTRNNAPLHAAALAFYTTISLAPLQILAFIVVGQSHEKVVAEFVLSEIGRIGGKEAGSLVEDIVNSRNSPSSMLAKVISILFLIFGASAVVLELQASIHAMWNLVAKPGDVKRNAFAFAKQWLVSAAIAMIFGYVLLIALVINTLWATFYNKFVQSVLSDFGLVAPPASIWGSLVIYVLVFAIIFKFLPQARIQSRDALLGAGLTASLFWLGNYVINFYFSHIFFASIYGAAGSIVIFLLWVDYSAMIVLVGAKFTQVYASKHGRPIQPHENMMLE